MTATIAAPRRTPLQAVSGGWLLALPALVFLAALLLWPLIQMARESLSEASTYADLWTSALYRRVFWNTASTAALVTAISFLIGFPYAYVMYRAKRRTTRILLLAAVLLPFWSSLLVRSFAWIALLQDSGLINQLLTGLGLVSGPLPLIRTQAGVLIGMVHIMLPYMVLPLFATMLRIDDRLLLAATSLGASPWQRFVRIFAPLSAAGMFAGVLLVFTLSLGFYITPALLGGPRQIMIGEVIADEVQQFALPTASALGLVLLAGTLVLLGLVVAAMSRSRGRS